MSSQEYENLTRMLAFHLRSLEEQFVPTEIQDIYLGCTWKDLLAWYLTEVNIYFIMFVID